MLASAGKAWSAKAIVTRSTAGFGYILMGFWFCKPAKLSVKLVAK